MEESEVHNMTSEPENTKKEDILNATICSACVFFIVSCLGWAIVSPNPKLVFGIHLIAASIVTLLYSLSCLYSYITYKE